MRENPPDLRSKPFPKWITVCLEAMGVVYVAVAFLFLINPDSIILWINKAFSHTNWPMVFFPTERFWYSLAWSVPGTRAFLVFSAARRPAAATLFLWPLQISLLLAAAMFAFQFFGPPARPALCTGMSRRTGANTVLWYPDASDVVMAIYTRSVACRLLFFLDKIGTSGYGNVTFLGGTYRYILAS